MSFGNVLSAGTVQALFQLDTTAATAAINSTINQTNTLKAAFNTRFTINIDNRQALTSIQQTHTAASALKSTLETIAGYEVFRGLIDGAKAFVDTALTMNASLQQAQLKFEALTGSAQTATTLMTQLEDIASHSTFGLAQITAASGSLLAFNVNAANVPALMNAIQNATAAAGGNMETNFGNITRVLGELAGGLPLTERQVRQLVTAGVPLQQLADNLGITVDQLLNVGKTGIVTGQQLVAAFADVYNNGTLGDFMQRQAGTFTGAMEIIKTNLSLASAQAFQPFFALISDIAVKIGEFVQTPTFNQWVTQIQSAVGAAIDIFKELGAVLAPIGDALAQFFGFNTANIGAEMAAAATSKPTFTPYDPSLGANDTAAANSKEKLAGYKQAIDGATQALVPLNQQLIDNKKALDDNAASIANIKAQYDPMIKSAEASIRQINLLTPAEQARKTDELRLDQQKAALELTKPDVTGIDNQLLGLKSQRDAVAPVDTQGFADQKAKIQGYIDAMGEWDSSKWDDSIAALKQKAQDITANVGKPFDDAIAALREKSATLGVDATAGIDAAISALREKSATLGVDATDGIDGQLQTLRDHMASFNTEAVDDQINRLRDTLNQPAPNTTGLQTQLKSLAAQIESTTDAATKSNLIAQYNAIAAQKTGIETDYTTNKATNESALKLAENQKRDQVAANNDAKAADAAKIRDLTAQRKLILDNIADEKAANAAQIRDLTAQRKIVLDGVADQKKAIATQITDQETLKKGAEEAAKTAKAAIDQQIKDQEASRKAAKDAYDDQKKGYTEQLKSISATEAAQQRAHSATIAGIDAQIKGLDDTKAAMMAPYNQQLAAIEAQQRHNSLLDAAAAAQRKLDLAPYQAQLDTAKDKEQALLAPLEATKTKLDEARKKVEEQVAAWNQVKRAAEAAMSAIKNGPGAGAGGPKGSSTGGDAGPTGLKMIPQGGADSPLVTMLKNAKAELDKLTGSAAWKAFWDPATDAWDKAKILLQGAFDLIGKIDGALTTFIGDHVDGVWYELIFGKTKSGTPIDFTQQLVDAATNAIEGVKAYVRDHPMSDQNWFDFLNNNSNPFAQAMRLFITADDSDLKRPAAWYADHPMGPDAWGAWLHREAFSTAMAGFMTQSDPDLHKPGDWYVGHPRTQADWADWFNHNALGQATNEFITNIGPDLSKFGGWFHDHTQGAQDWLTWLGTESFGGGMGFFMTGSEVHFKNPGDWFLKHPMSAADWVAWFNGTDLKIAIDAGITTGFGGFADGIGAAMQSGLETINSLGQSIVDALNRISQFFQKRDAFTWPTVSAKTPAANQNDKSSVPGGVGPVAPTGIASGVRSFGGGPAIVSEGAGPELVHDGSKWQLYKQPTLIPHLPSGSSVLPAHITAAMMNGGVPGFAGGLLGDALTGLQTLTGDALSIARGGAQAVYNATVGDLGSVTGGGQFGAVLSGVADWAKQQMLAGITGALPGVLPKIGSALFGAPNVGGDAFAVLAAIRSVTTDPHITGAMLMGAAMETGLKNVPQLNGGPGAGYWQIEAGPGGQYAGQVDPYDPVAAARFMLGRYTGGTAAVNASLFDVNPELAYAMAAYNAEAPAAFYSQAQQDAAWSMVGNLIGSGGGAGWPEVVGAALQMASSPDVNGPQWNNFCERFAEMAERNGGFPNEPSYLTALAHGQGVAHNQGWGPPGSMQHWGEGYWPIYGHAAINLDGAGNVIGTSPNGIAQYSMANAPDNLGWIPPGMAAGGLTVGGDPHVVTVGDGPLGQREWHVPEPQLNQAIIAAMQSANGGTPSITIGDIYVTPPANSDPRAFGQAVRTAINEVLYERTGLRGH